MNAVDLKERKKYKHYLCSDEIK